MVRFFVLGSVAVGLLACANDLAPTGGSSTTSNNQPRDLQPADDDGNDDGSAPAPTGDDDEAPAGDDDVPPAPADDAAEEPLPPGPPPSEAGQSCQEWSDCGPNYANPNSGFDCAHSASSGGECVCNVDGNWDDACASIGGQWSEEECFCFMGADPRPTANANDWVADDEDADDYEEDERQCWWTWRETCEPDTWVDGGYEWVCNGPSSDDCGYEHDDNGGYWESGDCSGYWLRRCDDGSQKRYG
ncbi:MAG: hypothetical protein Q8O67_25385 [Deltaproteobacteria bacterium]|nr:hypothetical protein [Deltaproteobacteria bacterium]